MLGIRKSKELRHWEVLDEDECPAVRRGWEHLQHIVGVLFDYLWLASVVRARKRQLAIGHAAT